ncbi:MAG: class I SAM-dependent DNA methyltransferase [Promethearchaeota archaeon]
MGPQNLKKLIHGIESGNFQQLQSVFSQVEKIEENFLSTYLGRKHEGVYYTNEEISNFIVNEVLLFLIKKKFYDQGNYFIKINRINSLFDLDENLKLKLIKILMNTRICDPACGSGIFLLRALKTIYKIVKKLQPSLIDLEIRSQLLYNVYGYDINEQAIDLSILKLLKWYLDDGGSGINEILTRLRVNIKQRNTLMDSELGKFNIIIGNPPYGNILSSTDKKYLKEENSFYKDIYCTFLYKSLHWSNDLIAFLVPKSFLLRQGYIEFRNTFLAKANLLKIIDMGSKVFKDATNEVQILIFENKEHDKDKDLLVYDFPDKMIINYKNQEFDSLKLCLNKSCPQHFKSKKFFAYSYQENCPYCGVKNFSLNRIRVKPNSSYLALINRIEHLGNLNYINPVSFPKLIRGEEDEGLKLVRKKLKDHNKASCLFISARNDFSYYYIDKNKSLNLQEIEATSLKGNNYEYYFSPKLLIKHNNIIPEAIYTAENVCFTSSIYSLLHDDSNELKFLCAILNSALIQFYCTYAINNQKNTTINLNQYMIRHIPIVNIDYQNKLNLAEKVNEITKIFQENIGSSYDQTKQLLKEVDRIIFRLYSISNKEKQMIISDVKSRIKHFENIYC